MTEAEAISSESDANTSSPRRKFLRYLIRALGLLWAGGFVGSLASYLRLPDDLRGMTSQAVEGGPEDELRAGEGRMIPGDHRPFWIIRSASGKLIALPAVCTHRHCILQWQPTSATLLCPCHGGSFDLNGNVLEGPPPRPLQSMTVTVKGGMVYVYV